jgi:hypothetical protein
LRAAKNVNLGNYEDDPRMTPLRADKYERGESRRAGTRIGEICG